MKMKLSIQADAIRVALLKKFGGIWMDADTILLNREFLIELKDFDLIMFGDQKKEIQHIGFIYAKKDTSLINDWFEGIINNINSTERILIMKSNNRDIEWKNTLKKVNSWYFLGNGIIDPILKNASKKNFLRLDKFKMNVFPEINFFQNNLSDYTLMYQKFYFRKGEPKEIISKSKGIILLHNSWTPKKYKKMTEAKFLKQNILLSKLLFEILHNTVE